MMNDFKKHAKWWIPVLLMVIITPFTPYLDLAIASHFYNAGTQVEPFSHSRLLNLIYIYGVIPGQITVILASVGLLFSLLFEGCRKWRPYTLFVVLTLAIGSGLIIHVLLKEYWGRPRPRQVVEFGGEQKFRPYYQPNFFNQPEPSKSFPCGHCTMGFYFLTFVLIGYRFRKTWLFYSGIVLTALLSFSLSYARMAQGGHFLSDVLMSGLIMWLTAILMEWLIFKDYNIRRLTIA